MVSVILFCFDFVLGSSDQAALSLTFLLAASVYGMNPAVQAAWRQEYDKRRGAPAHQKLEGGERNEASGEIAKTQSGGSREHDEVVV
jgi:hypothetical protein